MFSLDYQTMSQTLQRMRYTGSAEASIPTGAFAKGTVLLEVQRGVIRSCIVVTTDGQQVNDPKQIAEQLARAGLLEWRLTTTSGNRLGVDYPSPPSVPPSRPEQFPHPNTLGEQLLSATAYPQRLPADPAWMSAWPFIYRQVYNLSTGQYSEQDIARLLRYPPLDLLNIFNELENMGVLKRRF